MTGIDLVESKLKENGYKLTNQRRAIIEVLFENMGHFLSAEEIYTKTREKFSQTNFSTVYRNLEILEKSEILHKTSIKDGASIYELTCSEHHHHHIICKECGKTEIIDFCPLEQIKSQLNNKDFTLIEHKFELYGYCKNCGKKKE